MKAKSLEQRMEEHINYEPNSGCWIWGGATTHDGYAVYKINNKTYYAHRSVYEKEKGPIPDGLTLDHICRVRCCVNPNHLEPMTLRDNIAKGNYGWRKDQTHCKHGHELSGYNVMINKSSGRNRTGGRQCRECGKIAARNYYKKKKLLGN